MLAQQRDPRARGTRLAAVVVYSLPPIGYAIVGADGLLVGREDEGGSLGDDFGEAGGTLPGSSKGADRVDAADVAEGGEAIRDGGPDLAETRDQLAEPNLGSGSRCDRCLPSAPETQALVAVAARALAEVAVLWEGDVPGVIGVETARAAWRAAALILVPCRGIALSGGHRSVAWVGSKWEHWVKDEKRKQVE